MIQIPQEDPLPSSVNVEEDDSLSTSPTNPPPPNTTTITTMTLCFCMLTHSYLLISVFPYSGFLATRLLDLSTDDARVGLYAGVLASSFMAGRAVTSLLWGRAADAYGRRTVLLSSLVLSGVLSLAFGLVTDDSFFATAVAIRFLLGCSNAIVLAIKTLVSELGDKKEEEARRMGMVLGMWGWGFLIAPAISGLTAEPIEQYPDVAWEGWFESMMTLFPFLLPNVIGTVACVVSVGLCYIYVPETISVATSVQNPFTWILQRLQELHRRFRRQVETKYNPVTVLDSSSTTETETTCPPEKATSVSFYTVMRQPETRKCLILYWAYSLIALTVDEAFPLFCLSHTAGFGLPEKEIGKVLSMGGLVFAASQHWANTAAQRRLGLYSTIRVSLTLAGPCVWLFPVSRLLLQRPPLLLASSESDATQPPGHLELSTALFLAFLLAFQRITSLLFFTSISVLINRTVDPANRATVNGLSVVGASVARGLGPLLAGLLMTVSVILCGRYASLLLFGTIGGLCVLLAAMVHMLGDDTGTDEKDHDEIDDVELRPRSKRGTLV